MERTSLIPKGHTLYFNEELHKYTDELGQVYTSATTLIGKYEEEKDFKKIAEHCAAAGRNPNSPKYHKYKGKTAKQLLAEWKSITQDALDNGNNKHNFLENIVNKATSYKRTEQGFINDKIYTIDNIIQKHNYGKLSLSYFERSGIKERYPQVYNLILTLHKQGYKFYAEIGCYDFQTLISGLIDLFAVKGYKFIVIDWKTNKAPIKFEAGYFIKDSNGNLTDEFKLTNAKMKFPIDYLDDSVGNHYSLQTSGIYPYLVETFGFEYQRTILVHIRNITDFYGNESEEVKLIDMPDFREDAKKIINHYASKNISARRTSLF